MFQNWSCVFQTVGKMVTLLTVLGVGVFAFAEEGNLIQPYTDNPHYLAWNGTPIIALGATGYHSWTPISRPETIDFHAQLNRLAQVIDEVDSPHVKGFVRCLPYDPMNHLHDGDVARVLQPWDKNEDGRYDLTRFSPEWEERLRDYLQTALEHELVVSLEVWDDWSITRGIDGAYDPGENAGWNAHPFNPKNNVNYDESVLPATTSACNAPFYSTIPAKENIKPVLELQKHYVEHLLTIAADYPNVMINVSNESRAHVDWSRFWAEYIREERSVDMMIGEMPSTRRDNDNGQCDSVLSPMTLATDERYDYVDIAQAVSGHGLGSPQQQAIEGGRRIFKYRQAMTESGTIKPLVTSKDYTRSPGGGDMVLWGRFVGGCAASRFHRPAGNHPESVVDFQHEAVGRLGALAAKIPFWRMHPDPDLVQKLPEGAGANALLEPNRRVVVQLIWGEESAISKEICIEVPTGTWEVRFINPETGEELRHVEAQADDDGLMLEINENLQHVILDLAKKS